MNDYLKVIEINGVKVEVDLRTAKKVETFKVGDGVKVLIKSYSDSYDTYTGVIVGFYEFNQLPSISVAYLKSDYGGAEIIFKTINSKSKDIEIALLQDYEKKHPYNSVIENFDNRISKLIKEAEEIKSKKEWFIRNYNQYFSTFINGRPSDLGETINDG